MIKAALKQNSEHLIYGAIVLLMALTLAVDLVVPLGMAVWVLYLLPAALAYLGSRPEIPLAVAACATVFAFIGYQFTAPGIDPQIAATNRILGVGTGWIVGITGYYFIRSKLAVRKEEWLRSAQVGLMEAMRGEQRLDQIGDSILRFLVNQLGAQAGAIFFRTGESFRRYAVYGAPADAPIPEEFAVGERLLGEVVKEGRSFLLDTVPDGYLYFGTGLAYGKPRYLMLAPATADGDINSVVELGFIGEPNELSSEFLTRVAESVGVAVRSAKYRVRLQELLQETRQQAEELQRQSEELRSTNEELEEQSRALQESQSRLELQQAELEQTNAQLEEQTQLLEAQRDDLSRAQASLQAQARELEQASRYKSEFLANMSHELRTPLNSLLIMARLLADNRNGTLSADEVRFAETIESSGHDLLMLINDILDISKIEAGRLELQPDRVRIAYIVEKLKASFEASAHKKGLAFRTTLAPDLPTDIETDPQRLEQVLKNFLSNAIKFTNRGEIELKVGMADEGRIAFTVRDTGVGIAAEDQETIFEAFRQADGTISRKYGGTGLGLSISRELARLLGGEIQLQSEVGEGSSFSIVLPQVYDASRVQPRAAGAVPGSPNGNSRAARVVLSPSRRLRDAEPPPAPKPSVRLFEDDRERLSGDSRVILVVEDDAAFARVLYDLAHELGFQCLVAPSADEGVTVARQYMPHAVILDIGLPDHSGLTVLDRLKRDARTRHIPVHVVSVSDYTQTAMSFGAVGYMLKPVKRDELVQALEKLEARLAQRMRRVLVIEDDQHQLESIRSLLATRDVETVGARTAAETLEHLKNQTFDCMVLDLSLPDVSGFDLLEQLSQDEAFAFPPVIVYTGRDLTPDEELGLRRFSKSIIIKGAQSPERLLDEVTLFLHQVVSELPEKQQQMLAKALNRDAALEGRTILVVEDDIRNVFALTSIFEPHGVTVKIARNGREALDALQKSSQPGETAVDLVLMDIMMPEMDGLTAIREIRSRPQWRNIPIIALTAKAMASDQQQCLAAGANDYLAKPLNVDKLLSLVRVWMPR